MNRGLDKEAYTGIPGKLCRYRGDAAVGLQIELATTDTLLVPPHVVQQLFRELGSHNRLLDECDGMQETPGLIKRIREAARTLRARRTSGADRTSLPVRYRHLVSPRLSGWLADHAVSVFGRPMDDESALWIQAALAGEGLLPMNTDRPGDFPVADVVTSIRGLLGRRLVYEERRQFMAVALSEVTTGGAGGQQLHVSLRNLGLPGFTTDFPAQFTVGGQVEAISIGAGKVGAYVGIWGLITGPGAVEKVIQEAAGLDRTELLKLCRAVTHGRVSSAY